MYVCTTLSNNHLETIIAISSFLQMCQLTSNIMYNAVIDQLLSATHLTCIFNIVHHPMCIISDKSVFYFVFCWYVCLGKMHTYVCTVVSGASDMLTLSSGF